MGFLWTQQAVQTCILSKRWKTLWKSSPSLNFYRLGFKSDNQFIHFVNSFLCHRENTKIDMFQLDWVHSNYFESEPTETWIHYAPNFRPLLISIHIPDPLSITLPDSLFACDSMEEFYLNINSSIVAKEIRSKPIRLLNLKRLNLNHVPLTDEFMNKLITGCPILEELNMKYCSLHTSDITINSHSLKILSIESCFCSDGFAFHLSISSLQSLHVFDADLGDIRLDRVPSLLRACMQYNQTFCGPQEIGYEFLWALSNVSHLELIGAQYLNTTKSKLMRISVLKVSFSIPVEEIKSKPIPLLNLKRLILTKVPLTDEFMKKLILGSPRLEELIIEYCPFYTSDITITSHSLKILSIESCRCCNGNGFAFHLYIPSLLSLHLLGVDLGDIRVDGMPSLRKACVHYNQVPFRPPESRHELLRSLSNVTHLELIGKPYQETIKSKSKSTRISVLKDLLEKELIACGDFVNLKNLHLSDWCMNDDFDFIARFIQLSPNLETLTMCHEKEILHGGPLEKFYLQIQFKRPEMIEIKCSIEHERVNELISTLKTYLGTFKIC